MMMLHEKTRKMLLPRVFLKSGRQLWSSSVPPAGVRHAIVGATIGAVTPFFPIVGAYRLACHVFPNRGVRLAVTGSAFVITSVVARDVVPVILEHADLVAPLALANAATAAAAYGVFEMAVGGPFQAAAYSPLLVGACLGAVVGGVAPYLYSTALEHFFGVSLDLGRYVDWALPVTIPTGAMSGALLGPLLRPLVLGVEGLTWTRTAAPALILIGGVCARLFLVSQDTKKRATPFSDKEDHPFAYLSSREGIAVTALGRAHATNCALASSFDLQQGGGFGYAVDDGKMADLGCDLRRRMEKKSVYADIKKARLAAALDRFPLLDDVIQVQPLTLEKKSLKDRQRRALITDAVARVAVLLASTPKAKIETQSKEALRDIRPACERFLNNDEDFPDEKALADLSRDALGVVALLQHDIDALPSNDDKLAHRHFRHTIDNNLPDFSTDDKTKRLVDLRELEGLVANARVRLPLSLWTDALTHRDQDRRRKRTRRLITGLSIIGLFSSALLMSSSKS